MNPIVKRFFPFTLKNLNVNTTTATSTTTLLRHFSTTKTGEDEWNDAWESAWLPANLTGKTRAPWETDVNFSLSDNSSPPSQSDIPTEIDFETKAFVEDMTENWEQRKGKPKVSIHEDRHQGEVNRSDSGATPLYKLENMKKDYRLKKQRIHAGLWMKEIEKMEEAKLGDSFLGGDNIDKLLDSCSEIFESPNNELKNSEISTSELKNKPDGWETISKAQDGSIWEMSQREEDILLQDFERRIAFNKFQIASFIKTHIFSWRGPVDGWKYMIEEIGPNARKGKGSVSRLHTVSDEATQPFREEKIPLTTPSSSSFKGR